MKNSEFIKYLQKLPQDAEVYVWQDSPLAAYVAKEPKFEKSKTYICDENIDDWVDIEGIILE